MQDRVEKDIFRFFEDIEGQIPEDQRKTLKLFLDKYIHLTTSPLKLEYYDFHVIVETAQKLYKDKAFPKHVGAKKKAIGIHPGEAVNVCLIEAVITVLNSKGCLKRLPEFNYMD